MHHRLPLASLHIARESPKMGRNVTLWRVFHNVVECPVTCGRGVVETTAWLDRVSWERVNERVSHEQHNREVYVPPISLFRWWARRPHALIGALIDAALEDRKSLVVSDPFSGGGTVALEAARRGLALYAQDLHPWAITGLATVFDGVNPDAFELASDAVLQALEERCGSTYTTTCPIHGPSELVHVFWARIWNCPGCGRITYLYPYSLLTMASRRQGETDGFFGCSACGAVSRHSLAVVKKLRCDDCGMTLSGPDVPLLADRTVTCQHDGCGVMAPAFTGVPPLWKTVLVYRTCTVDGRQTEHFDVPTDRESLQRTQPEVRGPLGEAIPNGDETSLLGRAGFERWADLYPPRQLETLLTAGDVVARMDVSDKIRARLRLALCGSAEMAGFLSRWDRYYPKAFEAVANHRFPALGFACETNLLARRGRGTLRRRFKQSVTAARWSQDNIHIPKRVQVLASGDRRRHFESGAVLATGSSERQLLSNASVDLVLTDPPYFDDVQYGELASLFLVWSRALNILPESVTVDLRSEAVANRSRGTGVDEYRSTLTKVFREARRTLKPDGRLILTFHNTDVRAWWALSQSLSKAGFVVVALAVAAAENGSDHPKRNTAAFTEDLVIECQPGTGPSDPHVLGLSDHLQADELLAAGRTVAAGEHLTLQDFIQRFVEESGSLAYRRIALRKGGRG